MEKDPPCTLLFMQYMKNSANPARLYKPKFAKLSLLIVKELVYNFQATQEFLRQYHPRVGRWSLVNNGQNLLNVVKNDP